MSNCVITTRAQRTVCRRLAVVATALTVSIGSMLAADPSAASKAPVVVRDQSFRNELTLSMDRGIRWLGMHQDPAGWWSTPDQPAITALALMAFMAHPDGRYRDPMPPPVERGFKFLLDSVRPDGGIHRTNLPTYNTALSMMALMASGRAEYLPIIRRANNYLIGLQADFGVKGRLDTPFDGGIGYGSRYEHSDMGNTSTALEALHFARELLKDREAPETRGLDWKAVVHFLEGCQNLPSVNHQDWVSESAADRGGFVYYPGNSMAGGITNAATGRVALRSYGSISYAGMMSYLYADLTRDDPRVKAVFDWLRQNYTLAENPGMGQQGLYFYLHTMAKALNAAQVDQLVLPDGRTVGWRRDLALRMLDLQRPDGSWLNDTARWMEKDPAMVTAYGVLTLGQARRGL